MFTKIANFFGFKKNKKAVRKDKPVGRQMSGGSPSRRNDSGDYYDHAILFSDSSPSSPRVKEVDSFSGAGGSFGGAGASGSWESPSCSHHSESSYGGSSYDSGSSSSSDSSSSCSGSSD